MINCLKDRSLIWMQFCPNLEWISLLSHRVRTNEASGRWKFNITTCLLALAQTWWLKRDIIKLQYYMKKFPILLNSILNLGIWKIFWTAYFDGHLDGVSFAIWPESCANRVEIYPQKFMSFKMRYISKKMGGGQKLINAHVITIVIRINRTVAFLWSKMPIFKQA